MDLPPDVDPELWIEVEDAVRCYLVGNAHTFKGRMVMNSPANDLCLAVSKNEDTYKRPL